jgi:hypothetical protein
VPRWPKITQQRKPKPVRLIEIRECITRGIHDPREIAASLGVTANLILHYANDDETIAVFSVRRGKRWGVHLGIAKPID